MNMDQLYTLFAWIAVGSFIVILIMGVSKRVVIFYDYADLGWTVSPFFSIIISLVIAGSIDGEPNSDPYGNPISIIVSILGIILALIGCFKIFHSAIKHNGLILGILIAIFKVFAAVFAAIAAWGLLGRFFSNEYMPWQKRMLFMALFGALLWVMKQLINGEEVYAQRRGLPNN
jgi:xanthosine utilization system XapX-like protein